MILGPQHDKLPPEVAGECEHKMYLKTKLGFQNNEINFFFLLDKQWRLSLAGIRVEVESWRVEGGGEDERSGLGAKSGR